MKAFLIVCTTQTAFLALNLAYHAGLVGGYEVRIIRASTKVVDDAIDGMAKLVDARGCGYSCGQDGGVNLGLLLETKFPTEMRDRICVAIDLAGALDNYDDKWRAMLGRKCVIVGSASNRQELERAMSRRVNAVLMRFDGTDGVVPYRWVTPDGGNISLTSDVTQAARMAVGYVHRYANTTWAKSVRVGTREEAPKLSHTESTVIDYLLWIAKETGLFSGPSGNLAVRNHDAHAIHVSPRGVDKRSLLAFELLSTKLEVGEHSATVQYFGRDDQKPSIDTYPLTLLASGIPKFVASLHVHGAWAIGAWETEVAYPCGTKEEGEQMIAAYARARKEDPENRSETTMIGLRDHGHTLVFESEQAVQNLMDDLEKASNVYRAHLVSVGQRHLWPNIRLTPIFHREQIVGVMAVLQGYHSVFLLPEARGSGIGRGIVRLLIERQATVAVHKDCDVAKFYRSRGFTESPGEGIMDGKLIFHPPKAE